MRMNNEIKQVVEPDLRCVMVIERTVGAAGAAIGDRRLKRTATFGSEFWIHLILTLVSIFSSKVLERYDTASFHQYSIGCFVNVANLQP